MEILTNTKKGFKFAYIYYESPDDILYDQINADILIVYQSPTTFHKGYYQSFWTLHHDLSKGHVELFHTIRKNCKYEINRAEKRDEVIFKSTECPSIKEIQDFTIFYNQFAETKGLGKCNTNQLVELSQHKMLTLTFAENNKNRILCSHAFITNHKIARLLYSASLFRSEFKDKNALIGRANRYLHWQEILFFKHQNYQIYDFGGYAYQTNDPSLEGINSFKESFGGQLIQQYHLMIPLSFKGKIGAFYLKNKWN